LITVYLYFPDNTLNHWYQMVIQGIGSMYMEASLKELRSAYRKNSSVFNIFAKRVFTVTFVKINLLLF